MVGLSRASCSLLHIYATATLLVALCRVLVQDALTFLCCPVPIGQMVMLWHIFHRR